MGTISPRQTATPCGFRPRHAQAVGAEARDQVSEPRTRLDAVVPYDERDSGRMRPGCQRDEALR